MTVAALALRLTLAFVLVAAAAGKLSTRASRAQYREMFIAMGIPARWRTAVAVALVVAEIGTAALLVPPRAAIPGSVAAAALFTVLAVGVRHVVRGARQVRCNCFGSAKAVPLSPIHVLRNGVLVLFAVAASGLSIAGGPVSAPGVLLAAIGALVLAALMVRFDDVAYLAGLS